MCILIVTQPYRFIHTICFIFYEFILVPPDENLQWMIAPLKSLIPKVDRDPTSIRNGSRLSRDTWSASKRCTQKLVRSNQRLPSVIKGRRILPPNMKYQVVLYFLQLAHMRTSLPRAGNKDTLQAPQRNIDMDLVLQNRELDAERSGALDGGHKFAHTGNALELASRALERSIRVARTMRWCIDGRFACSFHFLILQI